MISDNGKTGFLFVTIADKKYSIPVSEVSGVLSLKKDAIYPIPFDTRKRTIGIINFKGGIVAILKPEGLAKTTCVDSEKLLTAVVLSCKNKQFAILVDQAHTVSDTSQDDVTPIDAQLLYGGGSDADN